MKLEVPSTMRVNNSIAKEFHRGKKLYTLLPGGGPSVSHSLCLQPLLLSQPPLVVSPPGSGIILFQRLMVNEAAQADKRSVLIRELSRDN